MKLARLLRGALLVPAAVAALSGAASAATIANGAKVVCVLHKGITSATVTPGTDFKLHVDDPSQPDLAGAVIVGHVTGVTGPAGLTRASITFVFDYIQFEDGKKAPFHAAVVGRNVTQTDTATLRREQAKFSLPPMPNGTVTPGPIAWQMTFGGGGKPSFTPAPSGSSGGVVYAQKPNEQIVIPPGSPVTLRLTADLTAP